MKSWYESKAICLGLATIVTAVSRPWPVGAGWQQAVLAAVGAANILLANADRQVGGEVAVPVSA